VIIQHFTAGRSLPSKIIMKMTGSDVSHVATQVGDRVCESNHKDGVIIFSYNQWKRKYRDTYVRSRTYQGLDEKIVLERMSDLRGKPYDWDILLAYPFHLDHHDKDAWGCSELAAYLIQEFINHDNYQRITPAFLDSLGFVHERSIL
jgi:uncharacterized protein YycO